MKITSLKHEIVEIIPEKLKEGIIYLSPKYKTAIHLCCCGCKQEVVTPLNPADWSAKLTKNGITLHPSIGNWSFACRSHYWIRDGKVKWSYEMSETSIQKLRKADQTLRENYINKLNQRKVRKNQHSITSWIDRLINKITSWLVN